MMDLALPPQIIELPRPAIIRPHNRIVTPAEARGIGLDPHFAMPFGLVANGGTRSVDRFSTAPDSFWNMIQDAGLGSVCHGCYDVADASSVANGTAQTMFDLVGGSATDFYRGTDGTAQAIDPTFNGTAGDFLEGTYYSFDGSDYMRNTAADSFLGTLHHQGCEWSAIGMVYISNLSSFQYFTSSFTASGAAQGFLVQMDASGDFSAGIAQYNGSGTDYYGAAVIAASTGWNFFATTQIDGGPTDSSFHRLNGSISRYTLSLASSGQSTLTAFRNSGNGIGNGNIASGGRLGCLSFFNSGLSEEQVELVYQRLKAKRHSSI